MYKGDLLEEKYLFSKKMGLKPLQALNTCKDIWVSPQFKATVS